MSNDLPVLTSLSDNSTEVPVSAGRVENYVLLLVVLCVFAGGTLVLLSLLLLFCHRCCLAGRRYSRASDDPEKMNTTYVEDSLPTQEITIRLDESDALSASSRHDGETERFLSTSSTGRRVSFNESALYEQERRESESKGRRYTLTEGDFHHLKKARLTHLHLAPPPSALNILTIMECDSAQSSTTNINETPPPAPPKPLLAIYQPPERGMRPSTGTLDWMGGQSLSGGLPGDPHHSTILDRDPGPALSSSSTMKSLQHTRCSPNREAVGDRGDREGDRDRTSRGGEGDHLPVPPPPPPGGHTSVLQFLSKLRRHASLEGAGPYFRKWKFDSSHRAASLDAKGSPRRKPFQRQRAASETTEHTEEDDLPPSQSSGLQSLSAGSLSPQPTTPTPPPSVTASLSRIEVEAMVVMEEAGVCSHTRSQEETGGPRGQRLEVEATGEDTGTGKGIEPEAPDTWPEAAGAWLGEDPGDDPGDDDLFEADRVVDVWGKAERATEKEEVVPAEPNHVRSEDNGEKSVAPYVADEETADDPGVLMGAEARSRAHWGGSSLLSFMVGQEIPSEANPPSLYRDIWSLRASLEQYASSDQSSTDRESVRSDADSVSSLGGAGGGGGGGGGARSVLDSCLSQDLDDLEPDMADGGEEGDWAPPRGVPGEDGTGSNMGNGVGGGGGGGEGEAGNRKLLSQMDSGYASIEAPPTRAPEELRLFGGTGTPGGPPGGRGKTASERRSFFTSSGRKGSIWESFEARVLQEEMEDETGVEVERSSIILQPAAQPLKTPTKKPLEVPQLQSQPTSPLLKPLLHSPPPPLTAPLIGAAPHRPRLRRRDYSIDEKTDALFNEFLRHDPRFDQQDSPLRSRHRSRVHLRKQWQRHKQYSDPGSATGGRYSPSLERQRFTPLRRGDSAGYPLDTRYHSTLSRIASAADEEASEASSEGAEPKVPPPDGRVAAAGEGGGAPSLRRSSSACRDDDNGGTKDASDSKEEEEESLVTRGQEEEEQQHMVSSASQQIPPEDTRSQSAEAGCMDPRVDNRNNNSSQAILSDAAAFSRVCPPSQSQDSSSSSPPPPPLSPTPSPRRSILQSQRSLLSDKLAMSVEERLYGGLKRQGGEPQDRQGGGGGGATECVVVVAVAGSPGHSPV